MTKYDRFLTSVQEIVGDADEQFSAFLDKLASSEDAAETELAEDATGDNVEAEEVIDELMGLEKSATDITTWSLQDIMQNEHFIAGFKEQVSARFPELESAIESFYRMHVE